MTTHTASSRLLVVGAGFSGAVVARELAERGHQITVIDKRAHVAGNAYDHVNEVGIRVHLYGPHLFHTSNQKVVDWLSRFTNWVPYKHKVKAMLTDGQLVTLPVNAETAAIVGADRIVDTFFRPYTEKMWGIPFDDVDGDVLKRVPVRQDLNEYYFPDDTFQALPADGYERLVLNILDHPNIQVELNRAFAPGDEQRFDHTFNAMPIDEYFDFRYGELPYRSIRFHTSTLPVPRVYPVATVNFTHRAPYTRVTEWKNLPGHGEALGHTTLTVEEPCDYRDNHMERYYPVKDKSGRNRELYKRYEQMVPANMTFIGRCGLYAYLDMHQAVNSALTIAERYQSRLRESGPAHATHAEAVALG